MIDHTEIIVYRDLQSKGTQGSETGGNPWRAARDRALGYLDAAGITAFEALDLSRQALDQARDAVASRKSGHPVSVSMQITRRLLIEQHRIDIIDHSLETDFRFLPTPVFPEWNRGNMIPQKLEIAPWNSFAGRTRKIMSFRWVAPYLGLLILLIYLYLIF